MTEISRRRRAERLAIRVWPEETGKATIVRIVNDSGFPIFDLTITGSYPKVVDLGGRSGVLWRATSWIAKGPRAIHPRQAVRLELEEVQWTVPQPEKVMQDRLALLQATYITSGRKFTSTHNIFRRLPYAQDFVGVAKLLPISDG
jgi:hypothetical protein